MNDACISARDILFTRSTARRKSAVLKCKPPPAEGLLQVSGVNLQVRSIRNERHDVADFNDTAATWELLVTRGSPDLAHAMLERR
jgi:hypothetical protein